MSEEPTPPLHWRLERAEGFLLLNMCAAARAELEALPPDLRASVPARVAWLQVAMAEQDWAQAAALASRLRADEPLRPEFWIWEAYARRRHESVAAARAVLEQARQAFPRIGVLAYNLACYACVEGDLAQARPLLREAFQLAPHLAEDAGEDEDLRALWADLDGLTAS